jgi:hypothetical protein
MDGGIMWGEKTGKRSEVEHAWPEKRTTEFLDAEKETPLASR